MKKFIIFLLKLLLLVGTIYYLYINYDEIERKTNPLFQKIFDYIDKSGLVDIEGIGTFINDVSLKNITDSGITGDTLSFSSVYYPYYETLNIKQKKIYKQVYANALKYKKEFKPVAKITSTELSDVIYAVNYDHPELFYLDTTYGYKYTSNYICVQIVLNYNEAIKNIEINKKTFDNEVNKIVREANKYKTNYEKEKYVHDYLVKNTDYELNSKLNQSAYSAIVNKKSVCSGYARSFQLIMTKLEIPTYYITGTSNSGPHAWNLISLSDGFYNIDVTFDDTTMSHKYFNMESNEFDKNHKRDTISTKIEYGNGEKFLGYRKVKGYKEENLSPLD